MPFILDQIDDTPVEDKTPSFAGGVDSFSRPSALKENQFALGENIDISIEGRLITRRGTAVIGANSNLGGKVLAIGYLDIVGAFTDPKSLIAIYDDGAAGRLKIWNGSSWHSPAVNYAFDKDAPIWLAH